MYTKLQVFPNLDTLSHFAAKLFVDLSSRHVAAAGRFTAALSGGSTPLQLYSLLGSDPYCSQIAWEKFHLFQVDERCVSIEDSESNYKSISDRLLSGNIIPQKNVHRIPAEFGAEEGALLYEKEIRNFFGDALPVFDLILLGMGADGHTASLFPGSTALEINDRLSIPAYMKDDRKDRITLALPVLNNARHIIFLVTGESKAAMASVILGDSDMKAEYPAGRIDPVNGDITWLLDRNAGGLLKF